jgi:hypothetical protein
VTPEFRRPLRPFLAPVGESERAGSTVDDLKPCVGLGPPWTITYGAITICCFRVRQMFRE